MHALHGDQGKSPHGIRKAVQAVLAGTQGERVKEGLCQTGCPGARLVQFAATDSQAVDELHLLAQVVMR